MRAKNRGGSFGNRAATAFVTISAKSFCPIGAQTLKTKRPPGFSTLNASRYAAPLSGKNITPNWQMTQSNESFSNGSAAASARRQVTRDDRVFFAAYSTIGWFKSVAV